MVREGYKQTEVGVIPEDWEVGDLKQFWFVIDCKHITAKFVYSGISIASIKEVQSRFVELNDAKQTTNFYYNKLIEGGRRPQAGDLIFSRNATVGEIAQVANWHPPFAMGQDVCLLRQKSPELSTSFLQSVIQSHIIIDQLEEMMVGSTFRRVNVEQIKNLTVPMPQAAEQRLIAQALSDVDALIAALNKLIAKNRDLKTATMQQLLTGKKRLPGFGEGQDYKESAIGLIPEDWDVAKFTDVTTLITCGIAATPQYVFKGRGYPFLSSTNVKAGRVIWSNFKYITVQLHKQLYRNNPPKRGDILYSRVGTIGEAAVIEVDFEFSVYVSLTLIKPKQSIDNYFLMHLLNSTPYKRRADDQVYLGGGVGNLNVDVVRNYPIVVPPLVEQRVIATVLSDMDAEIAALETRLVKTQAIKQGMMQELLTGRTRLL